MAVGGGGYIAHLRGGNPGGGVTRSRLWGMGICLYQSRAPAGVSFRARVLIDAPNLDLLWSRKTPTTPFPARQQPASSPPASTAIFAHLRSAGPAECLKQPLGVSCGPPFG